MVARAGDAGDIIQWRECRLRPAAVTSRPDRGSASDGGPAPPGLFHARRLPGHLESVRPGTWRSKCGGVVQARHARSGRRGLRTG